MTRLVYWHDMELGDSPRTVRRAVHRVGEDIYPLLFEVKQADMEAQSLYQREEKEASLLKSRSLYDQVKREGNCLSLKNLAITGKDLMQLGLLPGPQIGEVLQKLLSEVLDEPDRNTEQYLRNRAREMISGSGGRTGNW